MNSESAKGPIVTDLIGEEIVALDSSQRKFPGRIRAIYTNADQDTGEKIPHFLVQLTESDHRLIDIPATDCNIKPKSSPEFYETPDEIVNAYYSGKLGENYPTLTTAIIKIIKKELTEIIEQLPMD